MSKSSQIWPILSTDHVTAPTAKLMPRIAAAADLRIANRVAVADTGWGPSPFQKARLTIPR
jgi:hypothetical protein